MAVQDMQHPLPLARNLLKQAALTENKKHRFSNNKRIDAFCIELAYSIRWNRNGAAANVKRAASTIEMLEIVPVSELNSNALEVPVP
jgi:hypothetical protein